MPKDYTLDAWDIPTKKDIHFDDYVEEGWEVSLYEDPEYETGWIGDRVVIREYGDWRLRDLTEAEKKARNERIMEFVEKTKNV